MTEGARRILGLALLVIVAFAARRFVTVLRAEAAVLSSLDVSARRVRTLEAAAGPRVPGIVAAADLLRAVLGSAGPRETTVAVVLDAPPAAILWASIVLGAEAAPFVRAVPLSLAELRSEIAAIRAGRAAGHLAARLEGAEIFLFSGIAEAEVQAIADEAAVAFGSVVLEAGRRIDERNGLRVVPRLARGIEAGDGAVAALRGLLR